jgi:hypothetical protein
MNFNQKNDNFFIQKNTQNININEKISHVDTKIDLVKNLFLIFFF